MHRFPSGSFPLTCCHWAVAKSNFPVSNSVTVFGVKTCQSNPPDVLCCKYKVCKVFDGEVQETRPFQLRKELHSFSERVPHTHSAVQLKAFPRAWLKVLIIKTFHWESFHIEAWWRKTRSCFFIWFLHGTWAQVCVSVVVPQVLVPGHNGPVCSEGDTSERLVRNNKLVSEDTPGRDTIGRCDVREVSAVETSLHGQQGQLYKKNTALIFKTF